MKKYSTEQLKAEILKRDKIEDEKRIEKTFEAVCKYYNIRRECIKLKLHGTKNSRAAKMMIMYILRFTHKRTIREVAEIIEKDHSTVNVSSNKAKFFIETYDDWKRANIEIQKQIK
jgi:chromosomal replication initiation ATPase DnaA